MDVNKKIEELKIVPVVVLQDKKDARPLAEALTEGGLPVAEVTFRTEAAEASIRAIAESFPDMLVGAGTVTSTEQAKRAMEAGARFLVTAGFNRSVTEYEMCIRDRHSDEALRVEHLSRRNELTDISFEARKGEILGFGGLVGAGRSELLEAIFGYEPYTSGDIYVEGEKVTIRSTEDAIKHGLALVPEERKVKGIFAGLSVMENINIVSYHDLKNGRLINREKERKSASTYVDELKIRTTSIKKLVGQLSGGNQQKAILARWLRIHPKILMLDEPTHGIDIGAKEDIYRIIRELAQQGTTVLLVSSEMQELIRLSDRVIVMREGKVQGILDKAELSQDGIMHYAMGAHELKQ